MIRGENTGREQDLYAIIKSVDFMTESENF